MYSKPCTIFNVMVKAFRNTLWYRLALSQCWCHQDYCSTVDPQLSEPLWPTATKNSFG